MFRKIPERAAVIYIGSKAIYLNIAEYSKKDDIKVLESLNYPLNLGQDTFTRNKISFNKVNKTCKILKRFKKLIREYNLIKIKTVATTAIKEARNRLYILDQIKIKTGLDVEVIDDSVEKSYIYQGILRKIKNDKQLINEKALLSYIGTGNLGVSLYQNGNIVSSQNIKVGSLKLNEKLKGIQKKTDKFSITVREYLSSFTHMLETFLADKEIDNFITLGKEIEMIANLCQADLEDGFYKISRNKFDDLYDQIKDKTPQQLMNMFDLQREEADILLPSMTLYAMIWNLTSTDRIIAPNLFLGDILLYQMLFPKEAIAMKEEFKKSTIYSARSLGRDYKYNEDHAQIVTKFSLEIYDSIKEVHGLGDRERLLLHVASILHDVGKYMSLKNHYYHSYNIIMASNIVGLSQEELEVIANVARYHSRKMPGDDINYQKLPQRDRVLIAKLASILRIADAIDKAHASKFDEIKVELEEDKLLITLFTNKITYLEELIFDQKSDLFREVYAMDTKFKKRRVDANGFR